MSTNKQFFSSNILFLTLIFYFLLESASNSASFQITGANLENI